MPNWIRFSQWLPRFTLFLAAGSLALATLAAGCGTSGLNYDYGKEPDPRAQEFPIGPGDRVQVNVWRDDELTVDARVRPDGAITVPLVGDIRAAGRTASQIRDE